MTNNTETEQTEQIFEAAADYLKPDPNPLVELPETEAKDEPLHEPEPQEDNRLPEETTEEETMQEENRLSVTESPKIYYDPQGIGFYHSDFYAPEQIPAGAVEISEAQHETLLQALNSGCIVFDDLSISEPKPSCYHVMDTKTREWQLPESGVTQQLVDAKEAKKQQIKTTAQAFIAAAAGLDAVPDFEMQTWSIQAAEAEAWAADNTAETPVLAQIAAARGIDINQLRQAALRKARAYEALAAHIAGQRQALEDAVDKASTTEQVAAVAVQFTTPA